MWRFRGCPRWLDPGVFDPESRVWKKQFEFPGYLIAHSWQYPHPNSPWFFCPVQIGASSPEEITVWKEAIEKVSNVSGCFDLHVIVCASFLVANTSQWGRASIRMQSVFPVEAQCSKCSRQTNSLGFPKNLRRSVCKPWYCSCSSKDLLGLPRIADEQTPPAVCPHKLLRHRFPEHQAQVCFTSKNDSCDNQKKVKSPMDLCTHGH